MSAGRAGAEGGDMAERAAARECRKLIEKALWPHGGAFFNASAVEATIAAALAAAKAEGVAEERARLIGASCRGCGPRHVLANGRVWALCGTWRLIEGGIPEAEIAAALAREATE